jgi:hypothetical protein
MTADKVRTQTKQYHTQHVCEGKLEISSWDLTQNQKEIKHLLSALCPPKFP